MTSHRIPPSIIGTCAPLLAEAHTHDQLDSLFMSAGFPDDPPPGSKRAKTLAWLRLGNQECERPLENFGRLIAEFMDTEPVSRFHAPWVTPTGEDAPDPRETIQAALNREGLSYQRGGHILGATLSGPSRSLSDRLMKEGISAVEAEYRRAYSQIESDPPAAVTAACAILEAVCKTYLDAEGVDPPGKQVLGQLWSTTAHHLGLSPKDVADLDLKRILSGLSSIADGVAALRTHEGSAHGHSNTRVRTRGYRLAPRHARLAVHAAHTMALFVLETWEARKASVHGSFSSDAE